MPTSAVKKKTQTVLPCAHCMKDVDSIAISGQTAAGKKQEMISFTVCEPCYTKMRTRYGATAQMVIVRKQFWERVKKNAPKLAKNH